MHQSNNVNLHIHQAHTKPRCIPKLASSTAQHGLATKAPKTDDLWLGCCVLSLVSLYLQALFLMPGFPCTLVAFLSTEADLLVT